MKVKALFFGITIALLAGCSQPTMTDTQKAADDNSNLYIPYQCKDDGAFDVAYLGNQQAKLRFQQQTYFLTQVPSGSGTKYVLDERKSEVFTPITLFTKGRSAMLEIGSAAFNDCAISE